MGQIDEVIEPSVTRLRLINALEQLGDVYSLLGIGTQAITFFQRAIALWNRLASADKLIVLRLHGEIVETASSLMWSVDLPRFEAANQIGLASLGILRAELNLENLTSHPDIVHLLTVLSSAAWINQVSPDWGAAERFARAAVDMAKKLDAPLELSNALHVLDAVYFARGLLRERVQVALQQLALTNDPRFSDVRRRVDVLIDTSHALATVGDYDLALTHAKRAVALAEQIQEVYGLRSALAHFAYCVFRLDRWDEVLEILAQIREMQKRYTRERTGPECFKISLAATALYIVLLVVAALSPVAKAAAPTALSRTNSRRVIRTSAILHLLDFLPAHATRHGRRASLQVDPFQPRRRQPHSADAALALILLDSIGEINGSVS